MIDLGSAGREELAESSDVCIVGAGAAGLYLASRLVSQGKSVTLLEAGGRVCDEGDRIGMRPVFAADPYKGAMDGRAFGWGGSTSRWGGHLIPHTRLDLRRGEDDDGSPWGHVVSVVEQRSIAVLDRLQIGHDSDFEDLPRRLIPNVVEAMKGNGLAVLAGEFLPFRRRNLVYLVDEKAERLRTYLNAVVSSWKVVGGSEGSAGIESIEARSTSGGRVRVSAKHFIVAAGAIESARILLEVSESGGGRIFPERARVGAFLSDHLSCRIGDVEPNDRAHAARAVGPRFANGRMRSFRYVETRPAPTEPRSFAHFLFEIDNPAFRLAKETLFAIQARRFPKVGVADVVRGLGGLVSFGFDRYGRARLHIPPGTPVHLQLDIEQAPRLSNSIRLGDERDALGRRVPIVTWCVSAQDEENIRTTADRVLSRWPGPSSGLPAIIPVLGRGVDPKPHDAYHPVGTCRLGSDDEAVADLSLRVRGTGNLWVLSTGLFPTAGTANPTFSMLCLGDALADTLIARL